MKKSISILFIATTLFTVAQDNIVLRGYVFDKSTNQPLSMAAVQVKNTQLGALTEDNGYFSLPVPKTNLKDSIKFSYIGYLGKGIMVTGYKSGDTLRIFLENETATKPEAVITAMNAKGILIRAINNMKKNFIFDSLVSTGFYRQYHKENGKYVRLIESDVSIAFGCKDRYLYSFHELMQVNHQRRAENYETNGDIHGDHLADLLKENPFSYNKNNFLDVKKLDFYSPKIAGEDTGQYIVTVQYKEYSSKKLENAKIWVQKETYAITRIEIEKFPNPYYVKTRYENDSRWKLVNETDVIETEKLNGKYVVSSLRRTYNHHVLNMHTGNVDYIVEETFNLYFNDYKTVQVSAIMHKGNFTEASNLYGSAYKYDQKFWDGYRPLTQYPLNPDVKRDIEHAKPLEQQFKENGK